MAQFIGMVVRLKTQMGTDAGTDDHIYIGVVGTHGGREFPLNVKGFNDFEPKQDIKYWFGDVWDGFALQDAKKPFEAHDGWNDPDKWLIYLDQVNQVYVRKGGKGKGNEDDAYFMNEVKVTLYGISPDKRTFERTTDIWLANQYGLQVWLPEVEVTGRQPEIGVTGRQKGT